MSTAVATSLQCILTSYVNDSLNTESEWTKRSARKKAINIFSLGITVSSRTCSDKIMVTCMGKYSNGNVSVDRSVGKNVSVGVSTCVRAGMITCTGAVPCFGVSSEAAVEMSTVVFIGTSADENGNVEGGMRVGISVSVSISVSM